EHILVVDDNVDMLELVTGYLRGSGYIISTALNGKEAVDKALSKKPDLIVADWMMPVMSGPELVKYLKNHARLSAIPVILLTAKSDDLSKKEGISLGADAFLGKPFDQLEFLSLIKNLLKLKQGEMQVAALNREISNSVLRRFLPPELIKGILEGEAVFDNKPKNTKVTILMATLSHLRESFEDLGPENITNILHEYYSEMTEIIFSNKGIVDRFEEESIRALFGVPSSESIEEQVLAASLCALQMSKKLPLLIPEWNKKYEVKLNFKIAIHFGEAIVGTIGSPLRTDYTAMGSAVHIARHIENYAKDGEILISKDGRDYLNPNMWVKHGSFIIEGTDKKMTVALVIDPSSNAKQTA
ncbi:MAG: response regulator, partial [Oligoflexales bacterium]|nr:response regulator [Oligoflexales bacterium]